MGLEKTEKQEFERYFVHGDFSAVLDTDETLDIANIETTVTAIDNTGDDATATIIDDASRYVDGSSLYVRIKDGTEAESPYKITIRVETSKGNRWEVDGLIKIKET